MTTIDPGLVKQQKVQRPPGVGWILISLIAILLGAAVFTLGLVGTIEPAPAAEMNRSIALMFGGIVLLIAGITGWSTAVIREMVSQSLQVETARFGAGPGFVLALLGGALALLYLDVKPLVWWLLGAAVVFLVVTILASIGRKVDAERDAELRTTGQQTSAVVTDQGYDAFEVGTQNILTEVTVSFHDHVGTQRWVTRSKLVNRHAPIVNGQHVPLWFDPKDPSDEKRIVVDLR